MTEDTTPAEHPKTDALRAMGKYPLPRNVAEMLWIAAAEIDRLRAALSAVGVGAAPAETTHGHRFNPDERHKDECRECWQQRVDPVHVQQPAEHVFIQREDDLTDPWCMCCDAVKRPSAGAGSPSTPTPAEVPPICDFCRPHEFVPFSEDWTSPDSECEWCGAERREAVHVQRGGPVMDAVCVKWGCQRDGRCGYCPQRDERAERGDGGRDPHCALPHPHGRSNRCAGD